MGNNKITLARNLRRKQTDAERKMWRVLRGRQFENSKFRRQEPIGQYIVDFVSLDRQLIIELHCPPLKLSQLQLQPVSVAVRLIPRSQSRLIPAPQPVKSWYLILQPAKRLVPARLFN